MNATSTPPARNKGILFCPDCDFESPPDGEWRTVDDHRTRRLVCPDCGTVVDDRAAERTLSPQPAD